MKPLLIAISFLLVASNCLSQAPPAEEKFSLSPQLASELVDTITHIAERRRAAAPHGYEKDEPFFRDFVKLRGEIDKTLQQPGSILLKPADLKQLATEALSAYRANYQEFATFYSQTLMRDPDFKGQTIEEIGGQLLSLYVIVYSRNEYLADALKRGSYIWPFCRPKSDVKSQMLSPEELFYVIMNARASGASLIKLEQFTEGKALSRPLTAAELTMWKEYVPSEIILQLSSPYR